MKITVVGCGDAFGSGGRLQTCYHVETGNRRFLIDCGATAIIGLNKLGLDPNAIETIFISHLHGDHFAGLVWWMLHAQHVARRTAPLTVVGPEGIEARFVAAAEALFPRSTQVERRFDLELCRVSAEGAARRGGIKVRALRGLASVRSAALRAEVRDRWAHARLLRRQRMGGGPGGRGPAAPTCSSWSATASMPTCATT